MEGRPEFFISYLMTLPETQPEKCKRTRGPKPEIVEKYRRAVELYATTSMPCIEICRTCGVTVAGLQGHISRYHRYLMLARNGVACDREEAAGIKLNTFRRQKPVTRLKYKKAIEACDSMDYIEMNVSQIARMFGLDGTNLGRQLHTHYPEILEFRERARLRLGINDNLPRGTRSVCKEQYAAAMELLKGDSYITVQEAAKRCGVSYTGLEQHLLFYHKELVSRRIQTREKAVKRQCKGEITGRGTPHAPSPAMEEKYAPALHLYRTTPMSAARIAAETNVSRKGFYEYLQTWHKDLICARKGIPYEEGVSVDWSKVRKYNPATAAKYAGAIRRLKESDLSTAAVAAEFGLQAEAFRSYLKEHEPELHARQGMMKTEGGKSVSRRSVEKYKDAVHLYETTSESMKSIARRCGLSDCALRSFLERHHPELVEKRRIRRQ